MVSLCGRDGNVVVSESVNLCQGVPQGSVLGPFLFLVYVNDLMNYMGSDTLVQFADDTSVVVSALSTSDLSLKAKSLVERMGEWCSINDLRINCDKTKLLRFGSAINESLYVPLRMRSIPESDSVNFLGMTIDGSLKFESHIDHLTKKANKALFAIYHIRQVVSRQTLRTYYFACVQSLFNYGIQFWGSSPHLTRLFIIQKRILRCIYNVSSRTTCKPLFIDFQILTLPSLYIFKLLVFQRENKHMFPLNSDITSSMTTRNKNKLTIPKHTTAIFERGCYYKAILLYNKLPKDIRDIDNNNQYFREIKSYLINKCYYSVNEYLSS